MRLESSPQVRCPYLRYQIERTVEGPRDLIIFVLRVRQLPGTVQSDDIDGPRSPSSRATPRRRLGGPPLSAPLRKRMQLLETDSTSKDVKNPIGFKVLVTQWLPFRRSCPHTNVVQSRLGRISAILFEPYDEGEEEYLSPMASKKVLHDCVPLRQQYVDCSQKFYNRCLGKSDRLLMITKENVFACYSVKAGQLLIAFLMLIMLSGSGSKEVGVADISFDGQSVLVANSRKMSGFSKSGDEKWTTAVQKRLLNIKAMRTAKTYFMVFSPYLDTIFHYISTMLGKGEPSKYAKEIMDYLEKKSLMLALPDFRNAFETLKTKRAELFIYEWILNFPKQIVPSFFSSLRDINGPLAPFSENR
ncbi:hypothetical protein ANCDUO_10292 [Ancylostoma duodenale]|uniref:Uncharacterized protein n=1 Tax=Ancylostoma duodenale TaxID=51022 RepID=A0A0C2GR81_9BILA|nr:hypothetical protein ANCDUO_10292 [Ancylostoma duodenale]